MRRNYGLFTSDSRVVGEKRLDFIGDVCRRTQTPMLSYARLMKRGLTLRTYPRPPNLANLPAAGICSAMFVCVYRMASRRPRNKAKYGGGNREETQHTSCAQSRSFVEALLFIVSA